MAEGFRIDTYTYDGLPLHPGDLLTIRAGDEVVRCIITTVEPDHIGAIADPEDDVWDSGGTVPPAN